MEFNLEHCDIKVDNAEELRIVLEDDTYDLSTVIDASMGKGLLLSSKKGLLNLRSALKDYNVRKEQPTLSYEQDGTFEDMVTTWMEKHAFQSAPVHNAEDLVVTIANSRNAVSEMKRLKKLEFERKNLKRDNKPFYLNAPIGKRRR